MDSLPTPTVYIKNLNTKISKDMLKRHLYCLFSVYGQIIDIIAIKNQKMKGQAFVVYKDIMSATAAIRALNDFIFLGKELILMYSKQKSKATLEFEQNFDQQGHVIVQKNESESQSGEIRISEDPNNLLFVENLPPSTELGMITVLFQSNTGFKQVRAIEGRKDIVFVEFDDLQHAAMAKTVLDGFRIDANHNIKISFAKK